MQTELEQINIRPILPGDNKAVANIIRTTLKEFGADRPGTVYYDPTTDELYQLFQTPGAVYHIAERNGEIVGGGGIFPSPGLPQHTCELVKMYLKATDRGKGLGKLLINKCLEFATNSGYKQVYIETMPELKKAVAVYERFGFEFLNGPLGNTGHYGCDVWMLKRLPVQ